MSLKGKDFLKLLDYTPDEITELLDLAADLKAKKKAGIVHRLKRGRILPSSLRRPVPAPAAHLKWQLRISAWAAPISDPPGLRSG